MDLFSHIRMSQYGRRVEQWIQTSKTSLQSFVTSSANGFHDDKIWVIKYTWPGQLEDFFKNSCQLQISDTSGHTWGRGLYVTPLNFPRSTMMYGRVGIVGYIPALNISAFDATQPTGIDLFLEWAETYDNDNYKKAMTQIYPETFLHEIKSNFRQVMGIDLVYFRPDQRSSYVDDANHLWFLVSDFKSSKFSDRIKQCKWVLIVGEEFTQDEKNKHMYHEHMLELRRLHHPKLTWGLDITDQDIKQRIEAAYSTNNLVLLEP